MRVESAYFSSITAKQERVIELSSQQTVLCLAASRHLSSVASKQVRSYFVQQFSVTEDLQLESQ